MGLGSSVTTTHNKKVFANLDLFVTQAVDAAVEKEAKTMYNTMRYRRTMLGEPDSRYPVWTGPANLRSNRNPPSYTQWQIKRAGQFRWNIYNTAENSVDGFHYPRLLLYGKGWNNPKQPSKTGRLVFKGDRVFSSQMPNGITPWVRRKRAIIKQTISEEIAKWD